MSAAIGMTPEQLIKREILSQAFGDDNILIDGDITSANVDALYDQLRDKQMHWDYVSEMRYGEVETGLPCEYSRHYEAKSVATKMQCGQWVGWTYWYGGGKHAEPEAIDWMGDAYLLECKEEEKTIIVQAFTRADVVPA